MWVYLVSYDADERASSIIAEVISCAKNMKKITISLERRFITPTTGSPGVNVAGGIYSLDSGRVTLIT
jgi:hypothetical protein